MDNTCKKSHRYSNKYADLPIDQGRTGRHKCAGCAFEKGKRAGKVLKTKIDLDVELQDLPLSQAGKVRHKSPHAAYALGYAEGVKEYYANR